MKYLKTEDLQAGMRLVHAVYDDSARVLIRASSHLSELNIYKLKELGYAGVYVYDADDVPMVTEIIPDELRMRAIRSVKKMDIDSCIEIANLIAENLYSLPIMLMETIYMTSAENYTYSHAVNVCLLSVITGTALGMAEHEVKELAQAALLHDIGKSVVAPEILNKPSSLETSELDAVHMHSEYGYNILKRNDNISSSVREAVYQHHENEDGTGYPNGVTGNNISLYAKIIHIADVFDALTSKRCYKDAMSPEDAIIYLKSNAGTQFDGSILQVFVLHIALYQLGSTVQLSNGKLATVIANNPFNLLKPIVRQENGLPLDLANSLHVCVDRLVF